MKNILIIAIIMVIGLEVCIFISNDRRIRDLERQVDAPVAKPAPVEKSKPVVLGTTRADLLEAIKQVESGGDSEAVGDNGQSIGAYQIQRAYFDDAVGFSPKLGAYQYEDVKKDNVSLLVIRAYWGRYATRKRLGREPTLEDLARIHNGGPNGYKKQATEKYWAKVRKELK